MEAVNAAPEYMIGKKLVAEGKSIAPETLADTSIPILPGTRYCMVLILRGG